MSRFRQRRIDAGAQPVSEVGEEVIRPSGVRLRGGLRLKALALSALMAATFAGTADQAMAAAKAQVKDGTLKVTGDATSEKIALRLDPNSPTRLQVDVGADGTAEFSFDRSRFTAIEVAGGAGDDMLVVDQTAGAFTDELVTLNGGNGADTLIGGSGDDVLIGGRDADVADGNPGADKAMLGDGDDRFQWDPGDASDVVDGQGGADRLDFNGSNAPENIAVSPSGKRVRLTRDVGAVTTNLDTVERLAISTRGSTDHVVVDDLAGTATNAVDVDLQGGGGSGDAQPDTVVTNATGGADAVSVGGSGGDVVVGGLAAQTRVAGGEAIDAVNVATLGAADTVTTGVGVPGPAEVNVDGGEGADITKYAGTTDADQIAVTANGAEVRTSAPATAPVDTIAVEDLMVQGADGADTISAVGNLAALARLTFEGGNGADTLLGGNGADQLAGGEGADVVDGNQGADKALLGDGDDRFQWDPGDGSDTVEGQAGSDRLDFNGSNAPENIEASANGTRVRLTRDVGAIVMDLDTLEQVAVTTRGAIDHVVVNDLAGTAAKAIDVDLQASTGGGDAQPDTVVTNGTENADAAKLGGSNGAVVVDAGAAQTRVAGGESIDAVNLAARGGADTVTTDVGVPGPADVNVDGGEGADVEKYVGTAEADQIAVTANGTEVRTDASGTGPVDAIAVEDVVLQGLDSGDTISAAGNLAPLTRLTYEGGNGADTLLGSNGADQLAGGEGADVVDGNQGVDTASLGDGDDRFQWDPGDGSDTVEGQAGSDRLDFNGSGASENIEASANGSRVRLTRDVGAIVTDLDTVEQLAVATRGGTDRIVVNDLAGTAAQVVDVDLQAVGGGGDAQPDTVVANGTANADALSVGGSDGRVLVGGMAVPTRVAAGESLDAVNVVAAGGDDTIATGVGVPGPAEVNVDGGEGADVAKYAGTPDGDQIAVTANGTEVRTDAAATAPVDTIAVEDLALEGLDGDDAISAVGNVAPLTRLTFEGGSGDDALRGGNGADTLLAGDGADLVDGNQGADKALLGDGDDRFQWDPGDGSDTVEGQTGVDRLDFNASNASENIALSANGTRVRLARDVGAIVMDLDAIEQLALPTRGGSDTVTVNDLAGTALQALDVDLQAAVGGGDGQPDTVVTNGTDGADTVDVSRSGQQVVVGGLAAQTRITGDEAALDTLRVQTLGGDDDVTVAPDVSDLIAPVVDLGAGE